MRIGMTVPAQATLEATLAGFELAEGLGVDSPLGRPKTQFR
jgi:hypothetical protein